ncbi:MAG TPA: hypothetical protein VLT47_10905 [Anaeromyxobacteraceae bacterium]|nr:hypothetical protein [Anaeromyxobacteraceae bacterium]
MAETEQVGLQLDKSFEPDAAKAAAAAEKLDAALGGIGSKARGVDAAEAAMKKLRREADAAAAAMRKAAGGGGFGGVTPTALLGSRSQGGFERLVGAVDKLFGARAASGLVSGAAALARADDKLAPFGLSLADGATALLGAGAAVGSAMKVGLEVAAGLAAAAIALTAAFVRYGVEQSSKREMADAALGARGLANGHEFVVDLAAKYNLNEDDALRQVQKLLNAKFSQNEIPTLVRIKAGMDAAGLDGDALLQKLENMKLGSKIGAKDVEGLKKLGVDVGAVYAQLSKQTGETVDVLKGKVKAGVLDAGQAVAAVEKVAGDRFGTLADKLGDSVPGLLNRLRLGFASLFDAFDLGPLKGFLKSLSGALEGNAGSDVKTAASQLFGAISHSLFDPFQGPEGQAKLENMLRGIASLMRDAADAAREVGPIVSALADGLAYLGTNSTGANVALGALEGTVMALLGPVGQLVDLLRAVGVISGGGAPAAPKTPHDIMMGSDAAANDNAGPGGIGAGNDFSAGFVDGIAAGNVAAINAARDLVRGAVDAAREEADAHSPSRVMVALGRDMGVGPGIGMEQMQDHAASAGAALAGAGIAGARGGAQSGAAAADGGARTVNLNIKVEGGAAPDMEEAVRRGVIMALRDLGMEAA